MKRTKTNIALLLLIVFYTVGITGLSLDFSRELFLRLTPFNLLLTLGIFFWANGKFNAVFLRSFILVFLIGFFVEVAGVKTGVLFGHYQYGAPLGWKLWNVPLLIGVNWFVLAIAALGVARYFTSKPWAQLMRAALLMVLLDVLIEPVAIKLDFWNWEGNIVPLQNYVMWFVTALVVQAVLVFSRVELDRKLGLILFGIQAYFFMALNLIS